MESVSNATRLDIVTRPLWFAPFLLGLAATLSYVYADRNMPIADEGALLTAAVKILHGGVFYRDVDAYAFPGVSYLLAGAMSIFGEHLSVARALSGSFFCIVVVGIYSCALAIVDQKRAALCGLSLLSLKFFAFPIYTVYFYADASMAAAIVALSLFLRHRFDGPGWRLVGVGLLTGLSITTKQPTGIYLALVFGVVLAFPAFAHGPRRQPARLREIAAFALGLFLILGSACAYFTSHGLFVDMVRGALLRPFTGYLPTGGISFLPPLEWWNLGELKSEGTTYFSQLYIELVLATTEPIRSIRNFHLGIGEIISRLLYTTIPLVFGACAWLWLRAFRVSASENSSDADAEEEDTLSRARFFSAAGACLAMTVSAFPRADFVHIITIYPAIALMLFALGRPESLGRPGSPSPMAESSPRQRRTRVEAVFVSFLLIGTSVLALRHDATLIHRISMERADLWVKSQDAWLERLIHRIQEEIPEGEPFFVYGHEAHWYFLADRYTPRRFSQLYPGMTGDETGELLAELIHESQPRLIAQGVLRWPGMPDVPGYTRKLKRAIRHRYQLDEEAIEDPPDPRLLRVWHLRE